MRKIKELLKKANLTQLELCKELNIKSLSTINLKINNKAEFTTKEATILKNIINQKLNTDYSLEELFDSE